MVRKGNLAVLEVAISLKLERSCPPKLVYMHVTSMPICMNFLSRFRSIKFFDDQSMVGKGKLAVFESSNISETGECTSTKIGFHAFDIKVYLHDFFEPIPND